jgi:hypothetical protein
MRPLVIRQGDYLTKLAYRHGFDAARVWAHPANAALREKRPSPDELLPGDILHVPDGATDAGLPVARGGTLRASARAPEVEIKLVLRGRDGAPIAGAPFRVEGLGDPEPLRGSTEPSGLARFRVPVTVETCRLVLDSGRAYRVRVGHMDPAGEPSGALKRLAHLGYARAFVPDDLDTDLGLSAFTTALRAFQRAAGLPETGALDAPTVAALVHHHGS